MDKIIVEMVANASTMNKAVEKINMLEQLAHQYGWFKKAQDKKKAGITESEINNLKMKFTKSST